MTRRFEQFAGQFELEALRATKPSSANQCASLKVVLTTLRCADHHSLLLEGKHSLWRSQSSLTLSPEVVLVDDCNT